MLDSYNLSDIKNVKITGLVITVEIYPLLIAPRFTKQKSGIQKVCQT